MSRLAVLSVHYLLPELLADQTGASASLQSLMSLLLFANLRPQGVALG